MDLDNVRKSQFVLPEGTGALFSLKKNPKDMNEQIIVKLIERKEVSRDSIIYTFELPSDMWLGLNICKHIAIDAVIPTPESPEGEEIGRKYTPISNIFEKGKVEILIKTYFKEEGFPNGGLMSQYLYGLKIGDSVKMRGPFGKVCYFGDGKFEILKSFKPLTIVTKTYKTIAMIAGGTGIAPMYQILQAADSNKDVANFILLYSNKTQDDMLLRNELDVIERSKNIKFTLIHTLTRESSENGWNGERGRIDEDKIKNYIPPPSDDLLVLLCGTTEMTQKNLVPLLKRLGYSADNIFDF